MHKRLKLAVSKLVFCMQVSADIASFIKLLYNTKRFKRSKIYNTAGKINEQRVAYNFKINKKRYCIFLRTYQGDIDIFYEIFWKQIYKLPDSVKCPNGIFLDVGANIGMATVFFHAYYNPKAIISIELAPNNYALLIANTQKLPCVKVVNAAVMAQPGWVNVKEECLHYNNKAVAANNGSVQAITFTTIYQQFQLSCVDVLKMDIEGAEEEIFMKDNTFLHNVKNAVIEIHSAEDDNNCLKVLRENLFTVVKQSDKFDTDTVFWATRH